MPRRPPTTGYARLAQAEEEEDEEDEPYETYTDDTYPVPARRVHSADDPHYAPIQPGRQPGMEGSNAEPGSATPPRWKSARGHRRVRSSSAVDIKAINARLEKWAEEIATKFRRRKTKGRPEEGLEIHHTVFQAPDDIRSADPEALAVSFAEYARGRLSKIEFDDAVESVRVAIELGVQPKMISQGSSGSYFARNSEGIVMGVFKPKDEEPYASRNPKWTKWIHRNLFPFFFGRACLIPNLSYVSEAAAYVLDTRLQTNLVPYTDIVHLSSISFNYDFWDRRAYYRRKKPLHQKVGSFQIFLKGYKDANVFLKQHPWPDQARSNLEAPASAQSRRKGWLGDCSSGTGTIDDEDADITPDSDESHHRKVFWTDSLQQSFREQLEKLVVLDYIMRNTDRGLDNWMIRIDEESEEARIVAEPPQSFNVALNGLIEHEGQKLADSAVTASGSTTPLSPAVVIKPRVGAIDNSLSWPWKHPDAWRSFPFGWLFLPVSLIGQPFSEKTRRHFIPLLTSKQWWSDTQAALRQCFTQDADFKERMYARQLAVMKGQAWNVVETLKQPGHGPLELTRRTRVCVWDDLVDVPTVVPLRTPSGDMRLQARRMQQQDVDDATSDISSALVAHNINQEDFANNITISTSSPAPNRFNSPRNAAESPSLSPELLPDKNPQLESLDAKLDDIDAKLNRPRNMRSRTGVSFDQPRTTGPSRNRHKRHLSFSSRRTDDDEGDLGFAAARDMEAQRKQVIVERLETVKGKIPFFTWC